MAVLARADEQGRFFGILDGGRGLFEALLVLATVAVAAFALRLASGHPTDAVLRRVFWLNVGTMLFLSPIVLLVVDDSRACDSRHQVTSLAAMLDAFKIVFAKRQCG